MAVTTIGTKKKPVATTVPAPAVSSLNIGKFKGFGSSGVGATSTPSFATPQQGAAGSAYVSNGKLAIASAPSSPANKSLEQLRAENTAKREDLARKQASLNVQTPTVPKPPVKLAPPAVDQTAANKAGLEQLQQEQANLAKYGSSQAPEVPKTPEEPKPKTEEEKMKDQLSVLRKSYLSSLDTPTDEQTAQDELAKLSAKQAGAVSQAQQEYADRVKGIQEQATLQPFLTGRQLQAGEQLSNQLAALEAGTKAQTLPLETRLAQLQAKRQSAQERAKAELGFTQADIEAAKKPAPVEVSGRLVDPKTGKVVYEPPKEAAKPMEISPGASLYDPTTGKVLFTAPTTKQLGARSVGSGFSATGDVSKLSARAQAVLNEPELLNSYTPTEKGKILDEFASSGVSFDAGAVKALSDAATKQITQYDDLERASGLASSLVDKVNTGPLAGRIGSIGAKFGTASRDFIDYQSALANLNSSIFMLRSGAAVTPSEAERLYGFVPNIVDDEKTAKRKLLDFEQEMKAARENYTNRLTSTASQIKKSTQKASGTSDPLGIL